MATAVVIDLTSGERVVDTTDGMGDPDADDLSHDYAEIYLRTRFLDDASVFVEGLGEDRVHSLPGGGSEVVDPIDVRLPSQSRPHQPRRCLGDRRPGRCRRAAVRRR